MNFITRWIVKTLAAPVMDELVHAQRALHLGAESLARATKQADEASKEWRGAWTKGVGNRQELLLLEARLDALLDVLGCDVVAMPPAGPPTSIGQPVPPARLIVDSEQRLSEGKLRIEAAHDALEVNRILQQCRRRLAEIDLYRMRAGLTDTPMAVIEYIGGPKDGLVSVANTPPLTDRQELSTGGYYELSKRSHARFRAEWREAPPHQEAPVRAPGLFRGADTPLKDTGKGPVFDFGSDPAPAPDLSLGPESWR